MVTDAEEAPWERIGSAQMRQKKKKKICTCTIPFAVAGTLEEQLRCYEATQTREGCTPAELDEN